MSIDTHIHLFHRGLPRAAHRRHDPVYDATLDMLSAIASPSGVDRFVVVQPSFLGYDNAYLIEQVESHPATLRGVAVLDPSTPGSAIDALLRSGVVGIRLNLLGTDLAVSLAPGQLELVERCASRGMSIELHDTGARLASVLPRVCERAQSVVIDHFGRPDDSAGGLDAPAFRRLLALAARQQAYFKVSAPYRSPGLRVREACEALEAAVGRQRLLWGSDWPWTQHEDRIDYAGWCRPFEGAGDFARALSPTAEALYRFPARDAT